jgi:hypothetical protein
MSIATRKLSFYFLLACIFCFVGACEDHSSRATVKTFFKGLSFVGSPELPTSYDLDKVQQSGSNALSLMPFAYLDTEERSVRYMDGAMQWKGESIEGLKLAIGLAQNSGITCMIKPQLWIDEGTFTGYFSMGDDSSWQRIEEDYTNFVLKFAMLSEEHHLPLYCLGTELDRWTVERPHYWGNLINKIRAVYSGKLVYACNWDGAEKIPFWADLDYIGIDAYHPLTAEKNPSLSVLQHAWDSINVQFEELYHRYQIPILFTEWGYQACDYPSKTPWTEDQSLATNEEAQSNCYLALWKHCSQQKWFAGGFVWKWFPPDGREPSQAYERYSPQGRMAETTLREIYQSLP